MSIKMFFAYLIASLLNAISIIYATKKINCIDKLNLKLKDYFLITVICIIIIYNNYYNFKTIKLFVSIILTSILINVVSKKNIKICILNAIIISFISIIIEIIMSGGLIILFNNVNELNDNIYYKLLFSILHCIFFIITIRINKIELIINNITKIKYTKTILYYLYLTIMVFVTAILIYRGNFLNNKSNFVFSILTIINFSIMILLILKEKRNNENLNKINIELSNSFKAYNETIDECRELKHNLNNDLLYLKSFIDNKYKQNVDNLLKKYNNNYAWVNEIEQIPAGLQGLIFLKTKEAEKKGIRILVFSDESQQDIINDVDLCCSVGIIIDNAIEASVEAKSKNIIVNVIYSKNYINVKVFNKYNNNIDLEKITQKNYSTKKRNSGIGLSYITKIKKIKAYYKIQNDLFISNLKYKIN